MFRNLISTISLVLACGLTWGADPHFINFNTENGLPSNEVYEITVDQHGRTWFCTDRGVTFFNGYEFKTFTTREGLSSNTILEINTDPRGQLWFVGLNGSFSLLTEGGIVPFVGNELFWEKEGRDRMIRRMFWDDANNLYVNPWKYGRHFCRKITADGQQTSILSFEALQENVPTGCMHNFDYVIVGGDLVLDVPWPQYIQMEDSSVVVYSPYFQRLFRGRTDDPEFYQSQSITADVNGLYSDPSGDLWVSTGTGILRFPGGNLTGTPDRYFEDIAVSQIACDNEGNYWMSTLGQGIFLIPSFGFDLLSFSDDDDSQNTVLAIGSNDDHLICSTIDGRVIRIDRQFNERVLIDNPDKFGYFSHISSCGADFWLGNFRVQPAGDALRMDATPMKYSLPVTLQLGNGDLVNCGHSGADWYHPNKDGGFDYYKAVPPPANVRILCAVEVDQEIYLGTTSGMLVIPNYDFLLTEEFLPEEALLQCRINDIQVDPQGNLWLATIGNGLVIVRDGVAMQVSDSLGLWSNMVNRIGMGPPGTAWVGSNRGLFRVDYQMEPSFAVRRVQGISAENGLPANFIRDVEFWQGRVWVATDDGLVHFDPDDFSEPSAPPPAVLLEEIRINQKALPATASRKFAYDENDLLIHFVGVSYRKPPGAPFYRYRLVGADSNWTYTDDRSVQFYDLPAGGYTFEVAARNRNGVWSPHHASFAFSIQPYFMETWWFRSLAALGILLVGGGLVFLRWRHLKQAEVQRSRLQEARIQAREAELFALRSQMNPHFVFNALNSIQNFIFKKDIRRANYYLSRFSRLMRDGLQFSSQPVIPLEEEIRFLKTYLELEKMRFPDRFDYRLELDEGLTANSILVPPFLFQPLLENAVKHAFRNIDYPGELVLRFQRQQDRLGVQITDNGPGFSPELQSSSKVTGHASLGLKIVQDRITLLNAEQGAGTAAFQIDNLTAAGGQGTRVEFHLPLQTTPADESADH